MVPAPKLASETPRQFAGLDLDRPRIMGIVNVTPDSFSDGGEAFNTDDAVERGLAMAAAGADILDIGGESTRPGADSVSAAEETDRVLPVIERLAAEGALISIDSRRAQVMKAAVSAGAKIVNDVTALTGDSAAVDTVGALGVPVILMHMQGEPQTMQKNPHYDDPTKDIVSYLAGRITACERAGIDRSRVAIDPGIGFGKNLDHNLDILSRLDAFHSLGCPIVLGVSRKTFIGKVTGEQNPQARLPGSLAAALAGRARGVQIFRVHDVEETYQAMQLWEAIEGFSP